MVASAHALSAHTLAVRLKEKNKSTWWCLLLPLALHFVLDAFPHVEPSMLGSNPLVLGTLGFWWTAADGGVSLLLTYRLARLLPDYRIPIIAAMFGAWLPDFLWMAGKLSGWSWFIPFLEFHESFHWWRPYLSTPSIWILGSLATVLTWVLSFWVMPKANAAVVPVEASLTFTS